MDAEKQIWLRLRQPTVQVTSLLAPWLAFFAFLLWGWRVDDIFRYVPEYGDVLEVLWGTLWYHETLWVKHISPLYTSLVFFPNGWHTATLAHTPVFFLLTLPLYQIGGLAFVYNSLALVALLVSFAGVFRFVRLFASRFAAVIAALVFTFMGMHWIRVSAGHLHILWASSLLPWLGWGLERLRRASLERRARRLVLLSGLVWGVMINFSLYSVFLGGVAFSIWGKSLLDWRRLKQAACIAVVACGIGSPSIVFYVLGNGQDSMTIYSGVGHLIHWGASLNSIPVPYIGHFSALVRQAARSWYTGPYDESGIANLGPVTCLVGVLGLLLIARHKKERLNLAWLMLTGVILALGLFLKWNGEVVRLPIFRPLNNLVWNVGHALKPGLFALPAPEPWFETGVPLPGYILTALVPFWESGRVVSRYIFVGGLGMVALAACGLQRLPRVARYLAAIAMLAEVFPNPTLARPLPFDLHPAYVWLAQQNLDAGQGIVELEYPSLMVEGQIVFAAWQHQKPTASGVGSFLPQHTKLLSDYFLSNDYALSDPESAAILRQYQVRYIFLHFRRKNRVTSMWNLVIQNPAFRPVGCFEPPPGPSPWPYPICVAEVIAPSLPLNVIRREGWSGEEEWGIWSDRPDSKSQWIAMSRKDHRLAIEVFPFCVPGRQQSITIRANGQVVTTHEWKTCDDWQAEVVIPAALVKVGWNDLSFEYGYAVSPAEVTGGENPDPRLLAVGFKKLEVIK